MRGAVKSLVLVVAAGLVLALGAVKPASAGIPCWKALINDWFDGTIDKTYPPACYTQAIHHLPRDVDLYSNAANDIQRARLDALRSARGDFNPKIDPSTARKLYAKPLPEKSSKGIILRAIEWLGPSDAASVPLPLLVLAGVAFLLLAAAGGSFLNRWLKARRAPPPGT
jgi:hypothetical protein